MFSLLGFFMVLAAIPSSLMAQNNVTCFTPGPTGLNAAHCYRALRNIVYDSNGRLDSLSSTAFTWHKTCVINIQKTPINQPTKKWLEATVMAIANTCGQPGGIRKYADGTQAQVYPATVQNVYTVDQPVCQRQQCPYQPNDCLLAFKTLPLDYKGNFIVQNVAQGTSQGTRGNCTVRMQTTDSSAFRISHSEVQSSLKRILKQCGSHPSKIYLSGGTEGNNGDVRLSTQGLNNC